MGDKTSLATAEEGTDEYRKMKDVHDMVGSLVSKGWVNLTFGEFKMLAIRCIEVFNNGLTEEEQEEIRGFIDLDGDGIDDRYLTLTLTLTLTHR